jgi:hypothetical protein
LIAFGAVIRTGCSGRSLGKSKIQEELMKRVAVSLFGLTLFCALAFSQEATKSDNHSAQLAVNFVRLVNTAEMTAKFKGGSYAGLQQLFEQKYLEQAAKGPFSEVYQQLHPENSDRALSGYSMDVATVEDGKGYRLMLRPVEGQCGATFFSTEKGLIYQGTALGCDSKVAEISKPPAKN